MDYGDILSRAWRIIWKHKVLWIFGILAGCTQAGSSTSSNSGARFAIEENGRFTRLFQNMDRNVLILAIVAAVILLVVLWLAAIFLGTIGRIGVIRGTALAEAGADKLIFGELFSSSMAYFWRVLGLSLLVWVISAIAFLILGLPLIICTLGIGTLCVVPVGWFIQLVVEQASNAIVLENVGLLDGLRRGWDLVTKNLGSFIVLGLILYLGISLIVGFILGLPLLVAIGPILAGAVAREAFNSNMALPAGLLLFAVCFVAYLPVLLVLSGILRTYISSAWTLTYLRLTGRPAAVEPVPPVEPPEPVPSPL